MYNFLQFRADKKEAWRLFDVKQLEKLEQRPAFMTVLAVDQDPEILAEAGEDPLEHVKYLGPMYWDFDDELDIDKVLDDTRSLITWLTKKLDIPAQYIHCWLSGQKGVHVTVPEGVWGVRAGIKALPWIYREVGLSIDLPTLDRGVYSAGRGRMWRCEGIPRPGKGTYKVGVTVEEMQTLDAQQYEVLVASPRPPLARDVPAKNITFPKAESLFKAARTTAAKKLRAMKNQETVPVEALQALEGIPGCIEQLITDGDCATSNWNQAAMQLAAYIGARYSRDEADEYENDLIKPFVENVESASRPTVKERRKHVQEQVNRAFTGRMKFSMGPLIATMGKPCGSCPLCRADLREPDQADNSSPIYCDVTKIKAAKDGFGMVGENSIRNLTTFTFIAHTEVNELEAHEEGFRETRRTAFVGTLTDDQGVQFTNFEMPERAWGSRKDLLNAVSGWGHATVNCSDADVQKILRAVMTLSGEEMEKMTKTPVCGVILERSKGNIIPHYVEASGSFTQRNAPSPYVFAGDESMSPNLINEDLPERGDEEIAECLRNIFNVNEKSAVAAALGWVAACHFREHFQLETNQFPLLNLNGGAGAGKSSFATLICHLAGMDYAQTDFINVEVSTLYPLIRYVVSSTTVPRLVEEVNPGVISLKDYNKILGVFKASWNRAAVPRGYISSKEIKVTADKVSAPIVFTSEQPVQVPSLRNRSIEVRLTARALKNPAHVKAFKAAYPLRFSLHRVAKALAAKALNTSPKRVMEIHASFEDRVPVDLGQRPQYSMQVALTGLKLLEEVLAHYEIDIAEEVGEMSDILTGHLEDNVKVLSAEKSLSAADQVLMVFDMMAGEKPEIGLEAGNHYWRQGNLAYFNLATCMIRYMRFEKSMGGVAQIRDHLQMGSLIEGETYFLRVEDHPSRPGARIHVLDLDLLREKGTTLINLQDGTECNE